MSPTVSFLIVATFGLVVVAAQQVDIQTYSLERLYNDGEYDTNYLMECCTGCKLHDCIGYIKDMLQIQAPMISLISV